MYILESHNCKENEFHIEEKQYYVTQSDEYKTKYVLRDKGCVHMRIELDEGLSLNDFFAMPNPLVLCWSMNVTRFEFMDNKTVRIHKLKGLRTENKSSFKLRLLPLVDNSDAKAFDHVSFERDIINNSLVGFTERPSLANAIIPANRQLSTEYITSWVSYSIIPTFALAYAC